MLARLTRHFLIMITLSVTALVAGCALLTPLPEQTSLEQRLSEFPTNNLPLKGQATVYWDEHAIPFIEADNDHDAAFALGLIHAHLRLAQLDILRRISQGRLSELGGPLAVDIDHGLRIVNYPKAAKDVVARMPEETRRWMDAFVAGLNHYQDNLERMPHEYDVLGMEPEPWTVEQLVGVGRLAGTDVNWLKFFPLLELRNKPQWAERWPRLLELAKSNTPGTEGAQMADLGGLEMVLGGLGRGSNSLAVAGSKTRTGSALIATDPHLGLVQPNLWMIAGIKSPSYHAVGFMVPGLPFIAVGRNPSIGWGGTNMRSANSDLFDVTGIDPKEITTREEHIDVRWWFDKDITVRETPYGPIISDAPVINGRDGEDIALKWIGHRASDEITAMLKVNRAGSWDEFRSALETFAVAPQNMTYADKEGNVGVVLATHLPKRPKALPRDLVRPVEDYKAWQSILTQKDLPVKYNPPSGFVATANNNPNVDAPTTLGYFFSPADRAVRMAQMINGNGKMDVTHVKEIQTDVYNSTAAAINRVMVDRASALGVDADLSESGTKVYSAMKNWDGNFSLESTGALAYEVTLFHVIESLYQEDPRFVTAKTAGREYNLVIEDLQAMEGGKIRDILLAAIENSAGAFEEHKTWGNMHRLPLQHPLSNIPLIGDRYRFGDLPTPGSTDTLNKTAHDLTNDWHRTRYGANARHISDMADMDENYFVLMGGQDGRINAANFLDQVPMWQKGEYIKVPLRMDSVRKRFNRRMTLSR